MSDTILFAVASALLISMAAVTAMIATKIKSVVKQRLAWVIGTLLAALSAGALILTIANYEENTRESRQSCLDNGGFVYESGDGFRACFTEAPVELQKL